MSTDLPPESRPPEAEKNRPAKTEARKPRGLPDRSPADLAATEAMMAKIRAVYHRYGFDALETPFLEYTDALGKFLPDQDRPNAGVFSLKDDDAQWMSLRYDLTAPLARYCAEHWQNVAKPYRSYRAGWVFRNEKPGPGRFRQFMQFDADTVGSASIAADAEICMMAADTLEALGIPRGQYVIKVNNRKILDGVMEAIGLGGEENAARRLIVLRAIDKADKFPIEEIKKLLMGGRLDESGDFTKGANLILIQANIIARFLTIDQKTTIRADQLFLSKAEFEKKWGDNPARWFETIDHRYSVEKIREFASDWLGLSETNNAFNEGISELIEISRLLMASGYEGDRIRIDPSVVRGLEYYTGPVYEAELLFEVKDEDGKPIRFGSVGGGGRYDGLVSRFLDEPVPATGFSIGVSRLLAALQALGKVETKSEPGPIVVLAMDRDPAAMASYQKLVATLRNARNEAGEHDLRAEIYLGQAGMKAQMKYADRRAAPIAIIQGSNERERGTVTIKDLILGAELAASGKDRADYRERQAEAQFEHPAEDVVAAVRQVLVRQVLARH